jgi:hypothetical protein
VAAYRTGVDNPTEAKRALERVTTPKQDAARRRSAGFNPLARQDAELFQSVMDGEHCLRGFTSRDIRTHLFNQRFTCERAATIIESKARRSAVSFAAATLTA